jgi:cell division protein FtsB
MFLEPMAEARRAQLRKEIAAQEAEVAAAAAAAEDAREKATASKSRESSFRLRGEEPKTMLQ